MSRKALLIGINSYPGCPLYGCLEDIESLDSRLASNGDGSVNFSVRKLPDERSSGTAMDAIQELFSGDSDVALLYFSGHGFANSIGAQLVFPNDLCGRSYQKGIQMSDIMSVVDKSKVKNKIVILDCCHSGAIGDNRINDSGSHLEHGVTIMTACRKDETAAEMGGHGLFTELLCSALDGGAADYCGNITVGGIYSYIDKALGPWEQRPIFKTNVSEFVPIRTVEPKISKKTIRQLTKLFAFPDEEFALNPSFEFTNDEGYIVEKRKPYANQDNVQVFKTLQELQSIGFVEPVGEEHMYFAAMNSKSCRLTELGKYYWRLVSSKRF